MTWDADEFTDLFENAPIGIHWVGPDGIVLHVNHAELELMGYTRYVGRHIAEFHVDRPVVDDLLRQLSRGEDLGGCEVRLRTKDGSIRHVVIDSNVRWDGDRFVHTRCFTRDVTHFLEREQRARAEAEAANRMKDEFLATLSHELRTPLNAVLGWTVMLRAGSLDGAATARALEVIERNTRAQTQLIEDLLDVSRIVTGKVRLDVRVLDPLTVIEAALDSVRPAAEARGLRLQSILDPRAGPISGDPDRLQQVVWNLLSNAIKFTPRGGRVHVRLQRVTSHVEIVVSDTGQGIEPDLLPRVFDRFRQADSTTTRAKGGLGIGLAIVKQLVELHGGTVRVESPGRGQGATFVVSLPLLVHVEAAADRVHPTARRGATTAAVSLAGVRVLVVDDQRDALDLLESLLVRGEADVRGAQTVSEALDALATWRPDVIVSDIDMPGEDGYQLIETIRARSASEAGRIPAVAVTAYGSVEDRIRILSAGFQIHVTKPVEPAELIAIIASLSGRLAFTSDPHAKGHA